MELQTLAHDRRNVVVERLDVNDDDEVKALAAKYHGRPIDVLVNNAGVLGGREGSDARHLKPQGLPRRNGRQRIRTEDPRRAHQWRWSLCLASEKYFCPAMTVRIACSSSARLASFST
jgi:NAD(P)-dependent dehydrogenase (short-subunit alcohol dehydrogenase family)